MREIANCNLLYDNGAYFAWGETSPKDEYSWKTYKHMQSGKSDYYYINKYQVEDDHYECIWYANETKNTFDASDDVATSLWGDEWRMPTLEEWQELDENTTKEWTSNYFGTGVSGYILTSTKPGFENAYIFLPAVGYREKQGVINEGSDGFYWSSSLSEDNPNYGRAMVFKKGFVYFSDYSDGRYRSFGQSVRPVSPK